MFNVILMLVFFWGRPRISCPDARIRGSLKNSASILFSTKFYFIYTLISYIIPLITAIAGHSSLKDPESLELYSASLSIYIVYAFFGIWFKGCVYDIKSEYHTKRTCTKLTMAACLLLKIIANSMFAYRYCQGNKTGIIFVSMIFVVYFVHLSLNFIIYIFKIKFLLRTYWLGFLFYQLSRFCILIFFIFSIFFNSNHFETYIYALLLCIILVYMYMANYFNTLRKEIMYNSYFQAVFNYPFEWMNLFCCWNKNPKDIIEDIDMKYCCCDSFFLYVFEIVLMVALFILIVAFYVYICMKLFWCCCLLSAAKKNNDDS